MCAAADIFPSSEKALLKKYKNRKCGWKLVVSSLLGQEEFADASAAAAANVNNISAAQ